MRKISFLAGALICLGAWAQTVDPTTVSPEHRPSVVAGPTPFTLARAFDLFLSTAPQLRLTPGLNAFEQAQVRDAFVQHKQAISRAWINAVAAQQELADWRDNQTAAQAGADLGARMVAAGNWSQAQLMQAQRHLALADNALIHAQLAAATEREQLIQLLGLSGLDASFTLPSLPPLPTAALDLPDVQTQAVQQHLALMQAAMHAQQLRRKVGDAAIVWWQQQTSLPAAFEHVGDLTDSAALSDLTNKLPKLRIPRRGISAELDAAAVAQIEAQKMTAQVRSQARLAEARYRSAYALARQQQDVLLKLNRALQEEAQLRYNGMLISTWDLLTSAQERLQSQQAAVQALRDFWLAHIDLQAVLAGGNLSDTAHLK